MIVVKKKMVIERMEYEADSFLFFFFERKMDGSDNKQEKKNSLPA